MIEKVYIISSPVSGNVTDLSQVPDEVFAGRMMGDGVAIIPKEEYVCAPEDGEVTLVFETKHAIGYRTDAGITLLIHVGIDTVELNGKGFEALVKTGQKIKKGEKILRIDLDYIKKNATSIMTPVICTELMEYQKVRVIGEGDIKVGEPLLAIET